MASYADFVRGELLELPLKRPCCKKALTAGLLINAEMRERQLTVCYKQQDVAAFAAAELRRQLGKMPECRVISAYGHSRWELSLISGAADKLLSAMDRGDRAAVMNETCEGCHSALLRGAFLACGTLNDPRKSTSLELLLADPTRVPFLEGVLSDGGHCPGIAERQGVTGLYFKNGNAVEELITLMGAARAAMEIMNVRIERDIRNQENRATNCVAKNIEKSVSAASRQMAAIEKLTVTGMLAQLPEAVRATALLRAENPDATLEELRNMHNPPITKSGLNHRLQKLVTEAEKL